ncbi:hypothetical protein SAMN05660479_01733 [Microbulbifer thermotolerans]|nr:hypothetical protein SAMN05660479_01733 [Microbulbifer thermotolerans]
MSKPTFDMEAAIKALRDPPDPQFDKVRVFEEPEDFYGGSQMCLQGGNTQCC